MVRKFGSRPCPLADAFNFSKRCKPSLGKSSLVVLRASTGLTQQQLADMVQVFPGHDSSDRRVWDETPPGCSGVLIELRQLSPPGFATYRHDIVQRSACPVISTKTSGG